MGKKDPRIDAYIAGAEPFARPILKRLRALVHEAVPDVVETVKWSMPHFDLPGKTGGVLCGMAAHKAHCSFGLWNSSALGLARQEEAMGTFGRITSLDDLPSEAKLKQLLRRAAKLALKQNKKALAAFEAFPPSHQREYADWVADAKRDETRQRRVDTAVQWIAEAKSRNWKYEKR